MKITITKKRPEYGIDFASNHLSTELELKDIGITDDMLVQNFKGAVDSLVKASVYLFLKAGMASRTLTKKDVKKLKEVLYGKK